MRQYFGGTFGLLVSVPVDIMQQFEHPHIIKLIAICSAPPIWIVMELAKLGEVRHSEAFFI